MKVRASVKKAERGQKTRPTAKERDLYERQLLAAHLVGRRIVSGITDEDMATRMWFINPNTLPERGEMRERLIAAGIGKLREAEAGMTDARFSFLQRYARALGVRIGAGLAFRRPRFTVARTATIMHGRRRRMVERLYGVPPRRATF